MKLKKRLSLFLVLALVVSLLAVIPAVAAEGNSSGMEINKTATDDGDGTYTIQLEAYATGSKVTTEVTEDIPTDIILVLDQSGSMNDPMGSITYTKYRSTQNSYYYQRRHNGGNANLWHVVDGMYYSVSVELTQSDNDYSLATNHSNTNLYNNQNNLYQKVGNEYKRVTVEWSFSNRDIVYTYYVDGVSIGSSSGQNNSANIGNLYILETVNTYTYSYTDSNGVRQTIGTSTGADTNSGLTLYQRNVNSNGGDPRIDALKTAVTTFVNSVNAKAAGADGELGTDDDVNHRIAVVGFASSSDYGNNTELLSIRGNNSGSVGVRYGSITTQNYKDVLQDMDTTAGQTMVNNAINALATEGATEVNLGMEMAQNILANNPVGENEKRNRVVIVFTDGAPTTFSDFSKDVADKAIDASNTIKNTYNATVYSVGIFSGADATSAGSSTGDDTQKCNWFMQSVSSNNGTPQNPSYYLSAADAETLNKIFQQISDNIESGGSSTTLGSETTIKDIIAPSFTLPGGTTAKDISIQSYSCIAVQKNNDGSYNYTFDTTANDAADGASAVVDGDSISVSGFDFAANYCGVNVHADHTENVVGSKLVISFDVVVKDGFLGGNQVPTNTSAGVYENKDAAEPVLVFNRPDVDVAIQDIAVTAPDYNVYLLGDISGAALKAGASAKCGNVTLDLDAENFGLESWQNEYVDIVVSYKDKAGNEIADLNDLVDDTAYSVSVTVSPKTEGAATAKDGNAVGNVNVFKPVLNYKDTTHYYGDSAPANYNANVLPTEWKHGETLDADVLMIGTAPSTVETFNPINANDLAGNKINSKSDIPVKVSNVMIGDVDVTEHVTYGHQNCMTGEELKGGHFLLHVNTCRLTITKKGGTDGEPYVFDVYKDGELYTQASITGNGSVTIYELPVGTYTVEEDMGWSWRFTSSTDGEVILSAENTSGEITCTNTSNIPWWLNGFSTVVKNIFGVSQN